MVEVKGKKSAKHLRVSVKGFDLVKKELGTQQLENGNESACSGGTGSLVASSLGSKKVSWKSKREQ